MFFQSIFLVTLAFQLLIFVLMVLTLFSIHRSRKQDQNHFDIVTKHLMMIESKVGDLNVRVSMTEVRLEERKPQALLSAPNRSKRRNSRKPKEST